MYRGGIVNSSSIFSIQKMLNMELLVRRKRYERWCSEGGHTEGWCARWGCRRWKTEEMKAGDLLWRPLKEATKSGRRWDTNSLCFITSIQQRALVYNRWVSSSSPRSLCPSCNFSWSFVMVTWRCYGYITPKCHSLRSTTELLPVSTALTEAVHVPVLLETLPIAFCFVVFIIFLRAEPLRASGRRILRAIMKNAEQWILFPVDSWKGETGGLMLLLSFRMSHRLSIIWENM